MAVICCATPSELYLEETRSTLQFASRAKLVKTNAQVNEVLDERSMIRRLQRELAEAKRKQSGMGDQQVKDLEKQVETAGTQAMEAKAKLDRLKASILNAGYLFDPPSSGSSNLETSQSTHIPRKRRKSEGSLLICQGTPLKRLTREGPSPKTAPRHKKIQMLHHPTLPPNQELRLVQEALSVQNRLTRELKGVVQHYVEQIKEKDLQLQNVVAGNSTLSQQNSEAADELRKLQDIVASLQQSLQTSIRESEELLSEKETQANASLEKLQQSLVERSDLEEKLNDLTLRFEQVNQERIRSAFELAEITSEKELLMKETASDKIKLNEMAGKTEFLTSNLNEATKERDVALLEIDSLRAEMEICRKKNSDIQQSQEKLNIELKETVETLVSQNDDLRNANDCLATQVRSSKEEILALQSHLMTLEQAMEDRQEKYDLDREFTVSKMREMAEENSQLRQDKATNECSIDQLEKKITESDSLLQEQVDKNQVLAQQLSAKDKKVQILEKVQAETQIVVSSLRTEVENSRQSVSTLSLEKEELAAKKSSFEQQCSSLSVNLEAQRENNAILETANQQLSEKVEILEKENIELIAKLEESRVEHTKIVERLETCQFELEEELERVHSQNQDLFASSSELQQASIAIENEKAALMDSIEILREEKNAIEAALAKERKRVHSLTDQKDLVLAEKNSIEALLSSYKGSVDEMENQLTAAEAQISRLQREKDAAIAATGQALANIQTLSSQLKSKQNDIANLDFTKRELEKKFEETQAEVTALSQKIEATEAQLHETTCELQCFAQKSQEKDLQIEKLSIIGEEAKRDYERKTSSLENELDSMQRKFSQLKEDCSEIDRVAVDRELQLAQVEEEKSNLLCQMHDLSVRNDEMKSVCESIQSELTAAREKEASLKEELERSSISRDQFIQNLRECEAQRDKATAEVADLYEKKRQLSESISCCLPKEREEELRAEIAQLKIENKEARQLLASVNDSEDRLRTKVLQLENDLKLSYAELEGMMVQLSQRNEELTRAKKDLEEHSNIEESHSQLVQRIDALQRKNAEVEQLLLDEKKAWKAREEDLMHQMGEEQRALLQEGENQMSSLREELQECEAKLSQAESEAYTARQHVEELHDERRSLDEAYHGLKNQVTTLDSANIKLEAQVSELQSELSKAKSECYALKESAIDMKEKMRRSARDYEKAMKENEVAAKDVVTLRKKVGSLEKQIESNQTENSRLRKKYQDVEKSEKHLMALKEEVTAKTLEIEYLQKKITDLEREKQEASTETERRVTRKTRSEGLDVERLKEELQQKDQRIKKLEAVRMTKDQMAKIKSIKVRIDVGYNDEMKSLGNLSMLVPFPNFLGGKQRTRNEVLQLEK
jgi:chromosome segregation ATPase